MAVLSLIYCVYASWPRKRLRFTKSGDEPFLVYKTQQLLMWADYLRKPIQSFFSSEYSLLSFGELATVNINTSLPDDIWYQAEEVSEKQNLRSDENQLTFLGL